MDRYQEVISKSQVIVDDEKVKSEVEKILAGVGEFDTPEVRRFLLSSIDLTTLSTEDNETSVTAFTRRVNDFEDQYPQYPHVAARMFSLEPDLPGSESG